MADPRTIANSVRALTRAVRKPPAINPAASKFLDELRFEPSVGQSASYLDEMAALDRHFGRPDARLTGIEPPIRISEAEEFAAADPSLFGGPVVQRMMRDAELGREVIDPAAVDVMEMLRRNDRMNTLARVNAQRRGGESSELMDIAQQSIRDAGLRNRMALQADAGTEGTMDGLGLMALAAATGGVGGVAAYEALLGGPEEEEPIWRQMPTYADDGTEYLESPSGYDPIDNLDGPDAEVYVPPQDEGVVEAMLAEAMSPETQIDISAFEDSPALSPATDADLQMEMSGSPDAYLGRPRIPGMTDRQMDQMDTMVRLDIPPERAAAVIRGQAPISRAELEILKAMNEMRLGR